MFRGQPFSYLVPHRQAVGLGQSVEIRSEIAQVGIHSGTAGTQPQVTIELNALIQNPLGLVNTATQVASVRRVVSQLPDRAPKISHLLDSVVVDVPELENAKDSAPRRKVQIIFQSRTGIFESDDGVPRLTAICPLILVTTVVTIIRSITKDLS
jgi:hypothetical protein